MDIYKTYIYQALREINYQPRVIVGEKADFYREQFLRRYIPNLPEGYEALYWDYLTEIKGYYCVDDAGDVAAKCIEDFEEMYFFLESASLKEIYVFDNGRLLSKFLLTREGIYTAYISDQSQSFFSFSLTKITFTRLMNQLLGI